MNEITYVILGENGEPVSITAKGITSSPQALADNAIRLLDLNEAPPYIISQDFNGSVIYERGRHYFDRVNNESTVMEIIQSFIGNLDAVGVSELYKYLTGADCIALNDSKYAHNMGS